MSTKIVRPVSTVLTMGGKPIDWRHPPKGTDMVLWQHRGKRYRGSFRTVCHMVRLNALAKRRFGVEIVVLQPDWNTTVAASKGTHDFDAAWDIYIPGVDWWVQQRFFRRHGFGCWFRYPPLFGYHIHGFTLPWRDGLSVGDDFRRYGFKVGVYVDGGYSLYGKQVTSSQLDDYYREAFGLAGQHSAGSDKSWFPNNKEATVFDLGKFVERQKDRAERVEAARKKAAKAKAAKAHKAS